MNSSKHVLYTWRWRTVALPFILVVITIVSLFIYQHNAVRRAQARLYSYLTDSIAQQTALLGALIDEQYKTLEIVESFIGSQSASNDAKPLSELKEVQEICMFQSQAAYSPQVSR